MAAGLARAGLLREYIAPFGRPRGSYASPSANVLASYMRRKLERELRRRDLPDDLHAKQIRHASSLLEVLFVAAQREGAPRHLTRALMRLRNFTFDRAVAASLRPDDDAVICAYTAARTTFMRATRLGVMRCLEYPIAHHRFATSLLLEESSLQPKFASTLQFHKFSGALQKRLDDEIRLADRVFVLSTFEKMTFVQAGVPQDKLTVTPLGVDHDVFYKREHPRTDSCFRVVFVGQLTQRKGLSYLIDAFNGAALPNSELLLVGSVVGGRPWQGMPRIRHVPHVPRWELPQIYSQADVFVLPSLVEGFGLTALEAMACGLPVIVSENTFGRDLISDGVDGFLVPIRDTESIAKHLRRLHSSPRDRARVGVAAQEKAQEFSWQRYGDGIAATLNACDSSAVRHVV
jgi:starch synthase